MVIYELDVGSSPILEEVVSDSQAILLVVDLQICVSLGKGLPLTMQEPPPLFLLIVFNFLFDPRENVFVVDGLSNLSQSIFLIHPLLTYVENVESLVVYLEL
jgi:hypothetical protein